MSSIGGMYRFDGAPVSQGWAATLRAQMANGDGRQAMRGPVAMVYGGSPNGESGRNGIQPLISRHGELLVADLRIDNRDEMLSLLREDLPASRHKVADTEIIIAAYRKLGPDFLPKIIGEHALVLYDQRTRSLLLARDHIGARPLYWHRDATRILWSSRIGPLVDIVGRREVEDEYVAGHLTFGPEPGLTPFQGIHLVKPAHVMLITPDGKIREKRFWGLENACSRCGCSSLWPWWRRNYVQRRQSGF